MSSGVLVTGAAGLLGGVLAAALRAAGYHVLTTGRHANGGPPGLDYRACELADAGAVEALVAAARPAFVVHAAGRIRATPGGALGSDDGGFVRDNVVATANLAAAARAAGVRRFVFCSTISVYSGEGPFAESAPAAASDPYGATKRRAEDICLAVGAAMPAVVLRLGGLHGHPRQDGVVHAFFQAALRGEAIRVSEPETRTTLTFLDDVAGAVLAALARESLPPASVFNVATAEATTLRALAESVRRLIGSASRIEAPTDAKRRNRVLETKRLISELGYTPLPLAEHLARYAKGIGD